MESKWFFEFFRMELEYSEERIGPRLVQAVMKSEYVWIYVSFWTEKQKS